jgi:hypothetical protein
MIPDFTRNIFLAENIFTFVHHSYVRFSKEIKKEIGLLVDLLFKKKLHF